MRPQDVAMRLGGFLGLVGVLCLSFLLFNSYYAQRVTPHISVDGIAMGGIALDSAPAYLREKIDQRNARPLVFRAGDRVYQVTGGPFHSRYDLSAALAEVRATGHTGNLISRAWSQLSTLVTGHDYPLQGHHDPNAVARFVASVSQDVAMEPLPAQVGIDQGQAAIIHEPVLGRELDVPAATRMVNTEIDQHGAFDITLPVLYPGSPITHDVAQAAVDQARQLLGQNVYFSSLNRVKAWYLTPGQLVHLLVFKPGLAADKTPAVIISLDTKKLARTMAPIRSEVEHAPVPAYFGFVDASNGQPDTALPYPDIPGLAVDINKAAQAILASPVNDHVAVIPFEHPHSRFTIASARAMGFDTLQGRAVIDLSGLSRTYAANAAAAARLLNNLRLKPSMSLSVTLVISPVTKANGFTPALGGFGARSAVDGTNGGASAAASAVFQAAFNAGLPVGKRTAYPYLTVSTVPGTDAQVHARPRGATLTFSNNTKHILLLGVVMQGKLLKAYIFNNSAIGRTTTTLPPAVTLNQDGSTDTALKRQISGDISVADQVATHYQAIDQYP